MKLISLEIGSSAVKAAAVEIPDKSPDCTSSPLTLLAIDEEPMNNCVRNGRIQNVEDVKAHTARLLERLQQNPRMAGATITGVYTGIGGRSLGTIRAEAELALGGEKLITNEIIERLKTEALAGVPENREVFEIIPLRYTVDGVEASRPVGAYGSRISGRFTVVVCDPLNGRNLERVLVERLNLNICSYIVRPLAIAEAAMTSDDTNSGCMLVDLGAETTTVCIYKMGKLQYIATIPMGSRNITRDVAQGLSMSEEKAESIKLRVANAVPQGNVATEEQTEIDNYVQARANEIVANIVAQIGFAGMNADSLRAGIIVTGRGAKLRNLTQLIKDQSQLPVRTATLTADVHYDDPSLNPADFIDIIAVSLEARRLACRDGADATPCVIEQERNEQPEPEVVNVKEKVTEVARSADAPEDEVFNLSTEDGEVEDTDYNSTEKHARSPFYVDDERDEYDEPGRDSYDDAYLLEDDDVAEKRRQRDRERQHEKKLRQQQKAERKRHEEQERQAARRKKDEEGHDSNNDDPQEKKGRKSSWQTWMSSTMERLKSLAAEGGEGRDLDD